MVLKTLFQKREIGYIWLITMYNFDFKGDKHDTISLNVTYKNVNLNKIHGIQRIFFDYSIHSPTVSVPYSTVFSR